MNEQEIQDVLDELNEVRPEVLNNKAKRLFKAIMKIADDRDKANKRVDELINEVTLKDSELEKKDHIIDLMVNHIKETTYIDADFHSLCKVECEFEEKYNIYCKERCYECIKEYFTKKADETNG